MKKGNILFFIVFIIFLLTGCKNTALKGDLSDSKYLIVSTDQFGDNSELIGLKENGEVNYIQKLNFGSVSNICENDNEIMIYSSASVYKLDKASHSIEKELIKSDGEGKLYINSIKNLKSDRFYIYNNGFGEDYYQNAILKNDKEYINVEGTIMTYDFSDKSIYFVYSHIKSMSEGVSDFKLDCVNSQTKEIEYSLDLSFLNQYSMISGMIKDDYYYLYAYSAHDTYDSSCAFVKINLKNKSVDTITPDSKTAEILKERNHSLITMNDWYSVNDSLFFMQESGLYLEWNTKDNSIFTRVLEDHEDKASSLFDLKSNNLLIRIGYENNNLFLYEYNIEKNEILNKIKIDYDTSGHQVIYDFIIIE